MMYVTETWNSLINSSWWTTNLWSLIGEEDALSASDRIIHILREVIPLHSDQVTGRGCLTFGENFAGKVRMQLVDLSQSFKALMSVLNLKQIIDEKIIYRHWNLAPVHDWGSVWPLPWHAPPSCRWAWLWWCCHVEERRTAWSGLDRSWQSDSRASSARESTETHTQRQTGSERLKSVTYNEVSSIRYRFIPSHLHFSKNT